MKLIISISCVLAMALLNPCQGKDVTKNISDEAAFEKEMEREIEMGMNMLREVENIFGNMNNKLIEEPVGDLGSVWIVEIVIGGVQSNSTDVLNYDKDGDKHFNGSVIGNQELNKTIADIEHDENTTGATETPLLDKVIKDDREASIIMLDDDKTVDTFSNVTALDQKELNETITDEAELEEEIEIEIELDLEEANEEEIYEEMISEEIKEILQLEDILYETDNRHVNEPNNVTGPKLKDQGIISDDEGDNDEHEESGIEDQNKTIGMDSEMLKEVESEIALDEDNEEINKEIENMKIQGMNSKLIELQLEDEDILEKMDILENTFVEKNEAAAVHSANHATQDSREQQLYSQSTMRLVYFISSGILILSVLLLLIVLIVSLTKKEGVSGNPVTRYVKRLRLVSNASTNSKEFLI